MFPNKIKDVFGLSVLYNQDENYVHLENGKKFNSKIRGLQVPYKRPVIKKGNVFQGAAYKVATVNGRPSPDPDQDIPGETRQVYL